MKRKKPHIWNEKTGEFKTRKGQQLMSEADQKMVAKATHRRRVRQRRLRQMYAAEFK